MHFALDLSHADQIEHDIEVNFSKVVTVPVLVDGEPVGLVIYVGLTALGELAHRLKRDKNWYAALFDVVGRLNLVNEGDKQ